MRPQVLIVGWGGAGQTYLLEQFNKHGVRTNHWNDEDKVKHCTYNYFIDHNIYNITREHLNTIPVIYMYCDPVVAINSYYRRNFASEQHYKMNRDHDISSVEAGRHGMYTAIPNDRTKYIHRVMTAKRDLFNYKNHARGWMNATKIFPMSLEDIIKYKSQLSDKLRVPLNVFNGLEIKPRSSKNQAPQAFRDVYLKVYNDVRILCRKYLNNSLKKI